MPFGDRPLGENCQECEYRSLRLFCNLNGDALLRFDEIGVRISYPGRANVFEEGQRVKGIFVVCTGQLKLYTTSKEGRTMILRIARPGDVLGLSATINDLPYEVTAETLEPTQLKSVGKADFLQFLQNHSEMGENAAKSLAREYHETFLDARRLAISGSAAGRLGQLLLDWANTEACGKPQLRFTMALTHEELANMSGTSRETVTRLLNRFERDRLITRHGSTLTILDPDSLNQLA